MSEATDQAPTKRVFVGYRETAEYLGITKGTLSWHMGQGKGPKTSGRRQVGQYMQWVFKREDLDAWKNNRPGRGARTDRMHTGFGRVCPMCTGTCTVRTT